MLTTSVPARRRALAFTAVSALAATWGIVALATPARAENLTAASGAELEVAIATAQASSDLAHVITLTDDFTWSGGEIEFTTGDAVDLTVDGDGHTVTLNNSAGFLALTTAGYVTVENLNLSGSASERILDITSGQSVTIENVSVTGFELAQQPARIDAYQYVYLYDSTFSGNTSTGSHGGAVQIAYAFDVYVDGSQFSNNHATSPGAQGGALWADAQTVSVIHSEFTNNSSNGDGGALWVGEDLDIEFSTLTGNSAGGRGGAVFVDFYVDVENSTLSSNSAQGSGGALYTATGGVDAEYSQFAHNVSQANGGVFYVEDGSFRADSSTFSGNTAALSGGATWANNYADSYSSTFNGNSAQEDGGAVYTAGDDDYSYHWNSTFDANTAGASGGAIYAHEYELRTYHSTFTGNRATTGGAHVAVRNSNVQPYASVFADALGTTGCSGSPASSRTYNFDQDGSCTDNWDGTGDIGSGLNPGLGALAHNGGLTKTRLPSSTSVLVDAMPADVCLEAIDDDDRLEYDQRYVSRADLLLDGDAGCDIGAVEVVPDLVLEYYDANAQLIATATLTNALDWDCVNTYTLAEIGGTPPAGVAFPYGGFGFCIQLPGEGWASTVTWNFAAPVNQMWKIDEGTWSKIESAAFSGTTATYTIVDGDHLDLDGDVDGVIYDPVAAGVGAAFTG